METSDAQSFFRNCNAIVYGNYTLANGKVSKYYFDSVAFNDGYKIKELAGYFAKKIINEYDVPDVVVGIAYKGIPLCVAVAEVLTVKAKKPVRFMFGRKEKKDHGDEGVFVGKIPLSTEKVVIVDDVITDGESKIEMIEKLKDHNFDIIGIFVAFDRQEIKLSIPIPVHSLVTAKDYFGIFHPDNDYTLDKE